MNEKDDVADDQNNCRDDQHIVSGFLGNMSFDHIVTESNLDHKDLKERQDAYNTGSDIYAEFHVREQEYQNEDRTCNELSTVFSVSQRYRGINYTRSRCRCKRKEAGDE